VKNAALLLGVWVGIYLFAYSVAELQDVDMSAVALSADREALDESHGFALLLPLGWSVMTLDGVVHVIAPIAGIEAWAVSLSADSIEGAVAAAWDVVDPCSPCKRPATTRAEPLGEGALLELGEDGEGRTGRAVVLLSGVEARVLLVRLASGIVLPARVASDLGRMAAGFRVAAPAPVSNPAADVAG
jgi:hypothetical protein